MYGTAQTATALQTFVTIPKHMVETWDELFSKWGDTDVPLTVERVNSGAALLDEKKPDWVYGVLPERLDMEATELCIIGQSYGSFNKAYIPFGMDVATTSIEEFEATAIDYGFLEDDLSPFALLDRVWVFMLTERHARKQPVFLKLPGGE